MLMLKIIGYGALLYVVTVGLIMVSMWLAKDYVHILIKSK